MKRISTLLVGMTVSVFFTLCLPVFADSSGVEEPLNFRVSGIMKFGNDDFRGLIEAPDKSKRTLREGDTIDDWTVARISGDCIHLRRNSQLQQRCLTGSGESFEVQHSNSTPQPINNEISGTRKSDVKNDPLSHFKKIDRIEFLEALDGQFTNSERLSLERLSETILPMAGMPSDYQIVEIDASAPRTAQSAIEKMRQAVDQLRPLRLTLKNNENIENVIYLQFENAD